MFKESSVGSGFIRQARLTGAFILVCLCAVLGNAAMAQTASQSGLDRGQYIPNIWVDPDGCEHWIMDDGVEGFMTPHVTRDGIPVCREGNVCGTVRSDTFFATGSAVISPENQSRLRDFFAQSPTSVFAIEGHTDSVDTEAVNLALSQARANAVAAVARASGATVRTITGFGERQPVATNETSSGRAQNRRVEILCIN